MNKNVSGGEKGNEFERGRVGNRGFEGLGGFGGNRSSPELFFSQTGFGSGEHFIRDDGQGRGGRSQPSSPKPQRANRGRNRRNSESGLENGNVVGGVYVGGNMGGASGLGGDNGGLGRVDRQFGRADTRRGRYSPTGDFQRGRQGGLRGTNKGFTGRWGNDRAFYRQCRVQGCMARYYSLEEEETHNWTMHKY